VDNDGNEKLWSRKSPQWGGQDVLLDVSQPVVSEHHRLNWENPALILRISFRRGSYQVAQARVPRVSAESKSPHSHNTVLQQ